MMLFVCSFPLKRKCLKTHWTELRLEQNEKDPLWLAMRQNVWDGKESVAGLSIPVRTGFALPLQSVGNQRMRKKKKLESHRTMKKGICIFGLKWKRKERPSVFHSALSALRSIPAEKQNLGVTLRAPTDASQGGRGLSENWKPVVFWLCVDSGSHLRALSQTLRSRLPGWAAGREGRLKSCLAVPLGLQ